MSFLRKLRRKQKPILEPPKGSGELQLYNPTTEHFPAFIVGNAHRYHESTGTLPTDLPDSEIWPGMYRLAQEGERVNAVVKTGSGSGKTVAICGAGPSLKENLEYLDEADEVWGVNSAAIWLYQNGHKVTHAFTIDQTPTMLKEWVSAPPLEYLLATTCSVHLAQFLRMNGRPVTFFHSFVGINMPPLTYDGPDGETHIQAYEDWLYGTFYEPTVMAGSGLNGVPRAVDIALAKGFDRIILLGADCAMVAPKMPKHLKEGSPELNAWLDANTVFHVDGGSAVTNGQSPMTLSGEIDGRWWTTKADLMVTAVQIARWLQGGIPHLECYGDTLPNALKDKDDSFFDQLPKLGTTKGSSIPLPQRQVVTA